MGSRARAFGLVASVFLFLRGRGVARGREAPAAGRDPTIHTEIDAAEADGDLPKSAFVKFNHYDWKRFSIRWGGGFLWDYSAYSQDDDSRQQLALEPKANRSNFPLLLTQKRFWPHPR